MGERGERGEEREGEEKGEERGEKKTSFCSAQDDVLSNG